MLSHSHRKPDREALQTLLPIDVRVTITLQSDERTLAWATVASTIENSDSVS
jgi:hypothetical protein